jgi:hypothetical protein
MTKLLDKALEAAREAPPETQDDVARMILSYFGREHPVELSPEDEAAVMRAREAVARGEIATDERMRAIWAKYTL